MLKRAPDGGTDQPDEGSPAYNTGYWISINNQEFFTLPFQVFYGDYLGRNGNFVGEAPTLDEAIALAEATLQKEINKFGTFAGFVPTLLWE